MIEDFAHRLTLDRIRDGERIDLVADEAEKDRIATRLGLDGLNRLEAHATLHREGERIRATGRIAGTLRQRCVATGEPVSASVDEPFEILFTPEPKVEEDFEVELGAQDCDMVFHDGASIDLGAAIADTLALCLDPYPRSPGAEAVLKGAGVLSEEEAGPFAALSALKRQMSGDDS
ncbi:MAG: DUF177 domain-containing protein [Sphingomicrobium sp.]